MAKPKTKPKTRPVDYDEDGDLNTGPDGNKGAKRKAFTVPDGSEVLLWRGVKDMGPVWQPYVIKAEFRRGQTAIEEPYLRFRFLKDTGEFGELVHTVDLNDRRLVWRDLPSTLRELSPAKPCAFLFLTSELEDLAPLLYEDGNANAKKRGPIAILEGGTGGNGKWPIGAGTLVGALEKLVDKKQGLGQLSDDEKRLIGSLLGRPL